LEYPEYPNPGDSAIWLGTLELLRALGLPAPVYATEARAHDPDQMAAWLGPGLVLLQGGGSFGDVWPAMQTFREGVVAAFPRHRVVQLPQSIQFEDAARASATRAVLAAHPDLVLFVRDDESRAFAREHLGLEARPCPDLALLLDVPPVPPDVPDRILWLGRTDQEAPGGARAPLADVPGVEHRDWIEPPRTRTYRRLSRRSRAVRDARRASPRRRRALMATYERVAEERLAYALAILDRGRVVITDRLHGHLLCLLRGQPHVLLDNAYGKLERFHRAWTHDVEGVRHATSAAEALEAARELGGRGVGA
jgi:pyruvyl transferase EpsO